MPHDPLSRIANVRRLVVLSLLAATAGGASVWAQSHYRVVPGRGQKVKEVGDDFEAEEWEYTPNAPKSSTNIDQQDRQPAGVSGNNRVYESTYRGQPDVVKRVSVPPGGLPGSKGALKIRSCQTGIPGYPTRKMQQDDLLVNVSALLGGPIPVSTSPSIVVRVFLPPFEQWERRTGSQFGFRGELEGSSWKQVSGRRGLFSKKGRTMRKSEAYWPGFFIQFNSKSDGRSTEDSALLIVRADENGHDIVGPQIRQSGWWTLGMSYTPDGMTHFYASPGVDALSERDHIATTKPYGHTAEQLNTFFFNVVNIDDGRTWSTEWIVDDPSLYYYTR